MAFEPTYWTTHVGSVPHTDTGSICSRLLDLDLSGWPQFPQRDFRESMYAQFGLNLPGAIADTAKEKLIFDTHSDLNGPMEAFYTQYLEENLEAFALPETYASGFYAMLDLLRARGNNWVKAQVTGPISFGLTVTDQDLRSILYNDILADAVVKNTAMNARWQIGKLREVSNNVLIVVDEPYMASFGSAFISLSQEQAIAMLDEVYEAIHAAGGMGGVHCCANTDWSVLLATQVDVLNLDAYGYIENLALYPDALRAFLDRGGVIAWGIVPNNADIFGASPEDIAQRLHDGIEMICSKASTRGVHIAPQEFNTRSLITPSCGLGTTTVEIADRVFEVLIETGKLLQNGL
nr:hypothetical protein [Anaerolineae bacterium]